MEINQIGMVVKDMDKAIEYYESLGLGPFLSRKVEYESREYRGKPVPADAVLVKVAVAQMGPVQLELIQPVAGTSSHWMDFLKTQGEGVNHLGYYVDDFDKEVERLLQNGYRMVYQSKSRFPNGDLGRGAYLATDEVGGLLLEPRQRPSR